MKIEVHVRIKRQSEKKYIGGDASTVAADILADEFRRLYGRISVRVSRKGCKTMFISGGDRNYWREEIRSWIEELQKLPDVPLASMKTSPPTYRPPVAQYINA